MSLEKILLFLSPLFCCCENIWEILHLNFIQLYGMFDMVFTLMKRRWFIYLAYLCIPLIGLTYITILDNMNTHYVKPNLDEALKKRSSFGEPHEVDLKVFTLPEFQYYLSEISVDGLNEIPSKVMYTSDTYSSLEMFQFFSTYGFFNLGYDLYLPNTNTSKSGCTFQYEGSNDEIDEIFYESLLEEQNTDILNQYLGSICIDDLTSDTLSYSVEYEQELERIKNKETYSSLILEMQNNYTTFTQFCQKVGIAGHTFECENLLSSFLIHLVDSAYIFRETGCLVRSRVGHLPYHSNGFDFDSNRGDIRLIFWLPFLLISVLSLFMYSIISDKENGSRLLMDQMGLKLHNYLIARYSLFLLYFLLFAALTHFFGVCVMQSRVFGQTSILLLWIFFLGVGVMTISFAFFFSTFFRSNANALIPGYLVIYVLPGFMRNIGDAFFELGVWYWKWTHLIYPYPVVCATGVLVTPISEHSVKIGLDFLWRDWDFGFAVFSMYATAVIFFILYLYLEKVLPQNFSVRSSPLFCCVPLKRCFCCCCCCCCWICNEKNKRKKKVLTDEDLSESDDNISDISSVNSSSEANSFTTTTISPDFEKDDDVERVEDEIREDIKDPSQFGIIVKDLKKRYSKKTPVFAVDGISFKVPKNSLFGLLGENGAGKTTSIRILTGEISPTSGQCFINGKDVRSEIGSIRQDIIGVCHQHDILWDELSVEEHLYLYTRIRGVDLIKQKSHVSKILRETELIEETSNPNDFYNKAKKDNDYSFLNRFILCPFRRCFFFFLRPLQYFFKPCRKVRDLSAGAKRKLSLAISLCGSPTTLFLDEPCTGLDNKTERHIWKIILDLKMSGEGRSLILTTHSMKEAEILCDEIGIMRDGKFVAMGSSLHLKSKFGKGYQLKIIRKMYHNDEEKNAETKEKIFLYIHSLTVTGDEKKSEIITVDDEEEQGPVISSIKKKLKLDFGHTLIWELHFPDNFALSDFFEDIEAKKDEIGVKDWSLNQCSLDDVFVKLIGGDRQTDEIEELEQQIQELSLENENLKEIISLQKERIINFASKEEEEIVDEDHDNNQSSSETEIEESEEEERGKLGQEEEIEISQTPLSPTAVPKSPMFGSFYEQKTKKEKEEMKREISALPDLFERNCLKLFFFQLYVLVKKELLLAYRRPFWTILMVCFSSIIVLLLFIIFSSGKTKDSKRFFEEEESFDTLFSLECSTWVDVDSSSSSSQHCYHFVYTSNGHPEADQVLEYFIMQIEDEVTVDLKYRSFNDSEELLSWAKENVNQTYHAIIFEPQSTLSVSSFDVDYIEYIILHNSTSLDSPNNDLPRSTTGYIQIKLDEAILRTYSNDQNALTKKIDGRRRSAPRYPLKEKSNIYDVFLQIGPCFYAVGFTFITMNSARSFVKSKEIGLHEHLIRSGVMRIALYFSYVVYFSLIAFLNSFITYVVSVLFQIDVVRNTNFVIIFTVLMLYSFSLLSCISITFPFLKTEKSAQAINTIFMLVVFFTSFLFDSTILYSIFEAADSNGGWGAFFLYVVFPIVFAPINFCKIFADLNYKTLPLFDFQAKEYRDNEGYVFSDLFEKNQFAELSLETGPTIYWVLYLLLNTILYLTVGLLIYACVEFPFYELEFLWKWLCFWPHIEAKIEKRTLLDKKTIEEVGEKKFKLYLENLSKSYVSSFPGIQVHPVLKDVTLSTPENQLLGILGPNGSGKSTLVNLISGSLRITDGEIYVNNNKDNNIPQKKNILRVKKNMNSIRRILGTVPQKDILVSELRANEMLELFGVCSGLKHKHLQKKIGKILTKVGLDNNNSNFVGNYSGGMRRKMSIALSLIGEPSLIILDEPTTGIDVYSCYQIWKLFYGIKKRHTILLTSHKMSETELLSDEIAILNNKKFQIKGEPLELKERFGTGYRLEILLNKRWFVEDNKNNEEIIYNSNGSSEEDNSTHTRSQHSSDFQRRRMDRKVQKIIDNENRKKEEEEEELDLYTFPEVTQSGYCVVYSIEDKKLLSIILKAVEKMVGKKKDSWNIIMEEEKLEDNDSDRSRDEDADNNSSSVNEHDDDITCSGLVDSFGISQCSLESIYMKLTLK